VSRSGYVVLVSVSEPFAASLSEERLEGIARRVLEAEDTLAVELSVTVTDDETVRSLNREYAGEDKVTDVLSFSQREGEGRPLGRQRSAATARTRRWRGC
jgi:ssRNA-specific RNase YbeY (16S rRNA maturation enzyme)